MIDIIVSPDLTIERPRDPGYRQCSISVMDTDDDPSIQFDAEGRSNYYHEYLRAEQAQVKHGAEGERLLDDLVRLLKAEGRNKAYDCIIGVSGGVDSTYLAYVAKQRGLRPLAVHFDNGWNSELAVKNVESLVQTLEIDLHTLVVDWNEFRDLQLAYLKASVVDIEVPTDHAIYGTLFRLAGQFGVRHLLSGGNVATEETLPRHWIHNKTDHVNLLAIHSRFGAVPLRTYPVMDWITKKSHHVINDIQFHSILNWMPYDKRTVKTVIESELGWRDYGGKHHESIFTRFYQGYILPVKFGIDKRKAHLSNLIFSGQLTKEEALRELALPIYSSDVLRQDIEFVTKKLGLSRAQFDDIMRQPPRPHTDFAIERSVYDRFPPLRPFRRSLQAVKGLFDRS
jgi:N-acetyl sugar amidotransferase